MTLAQIFLAKQRSLGMIQYLKMLRAQSPFATYLYTAGY